LDESSNIDQGLCAKAENKVVVSMFAGSSSGTNFKEVFIVTVPQQSKKDY
jgi:hypothetical protein